MIYIINGYPQSGKDSVVSIFEELYPEEVRGWELSELREELAKLLE